MEGELIVRFVFLYVLDFHACVVFKPVVSTWFCSVCKSSDVRLCVCSNVAIAGFEFSFGALIRELQRL
jgi:hypothetical protein